MVDWVTQNVAENGKKWRNPIWYIYAIPWSVKPWFSACFFIREYIHRPNKTSLLEV